MTNWQLSETAHFLQNKVLRRLEMTREELQTVLATIKVVWPMLDVSNELVQRVWFNLLKHIEYDDAHKILESIIAEGRDYPPTPGHIIKRYIDSEKGVETCAESIEFINEQFKKWRPPALGIRHYPTRSEVESMLSGKPRALKALLAVGVERWFDTEKTQRSFLYRDYQNYYSELRDAQITREANYIADKGLAKTISTLCNTPSSKNAGFIEDGKRFITKLTPDDRKAYIASLVKSRGESDIHTYRIHVKRNDSEAARSLLCLWAGQSLNQKQIHNGGHESSN